VVAVLGLLHLGVPVNRLLGFGLVTLLSGCIEIGQDRVSGSGTVQRQSRAVGALHAVLVSGTTNVRVSVGQPESLVVEAQPNIAELIQTSVSDGKLTVDEKKPYVTDKEAIVRLTVPVLDSLSLRGSSNATIAKATGPSLDISIAGAGNVEANGAVDRLTLDCSGAGNADLTHLVARDAVVKLSGVGNANMNVTGTIDASIFGVGSVTYRGSARVVHQEIRGVGSLSHD
jgi:Putative auto-transporter adhesin, head GIN domain